jgi:hypothetical protein
MIRKLTYACAEPLEGHHNLRNIKRSISIPLFFRFFKRTADRGILHSGHTTIIRY